MTKRRTVGGVAAPTCGGGPYTSSRSRTSGVGGLSTRPQGVDLQVLEPDGAEVVLEADVPLAGEVLQRGLEFVLRPVGVLLWRGPLVQVRVDNRLAVQDDADLRPDGGDLDVVPLAGRLHRVLRRGQGIVD